MQKINKNSYLLIFVLFLFSLVYWIIACNSTSDNNENTNTPQATATFTPSPSNQTPTPTATISNPALLHPSDLQYIGAFRLPSSGADDAHSWEYSGRALTYNPSGDPDGNQDGYSGSLYGTGHDVTNLVSEISIPVPSSSHNLSDLPQASTLQGFHDITAGMFDALYEMPRVGLEYLPAKGNQTSDKLYFCWSQHMTDEETEIPSHGWCETNLSSPNSQGAWWIGNTNLYSTTGYIFAIPQEWADAYANGLSLATGRYRDGGWSGMGPSLYLYAPWLDGNPPANETHLTTIQLLQYAYSDNEPPTYHTMNSYQHSDEWEGGAWLTAGDKSAVVFIGTKGDGYYWYGYYSPNGDGMPCVDIDLQDIYCYKPDGTPCPSELMGFCEGHNEASRGWWSSRYDAKIIFYNPSDFVAVSRGEKEPWQPQPYASLDIDEHLFLNASGEEYMYGTGEQRKLRIGASAYNRQDNLLYILELFADGEKPLVHVWFVNSN